MQCLMQKRSVLNFIPSNYILASVLITTTNHITTRNSYRYPRTRCFIFIASTLVCEKRHPRQFRDLNVLFSQNRGCLQYIVCGTDVTYTFYYPHTTCGLAADSMAFTIHTNLAEAMPRPSPFWRGILQVPSYALPLWFCYSRGTINWMQIWVRRPLRSHYLQIQQGWHCQTSNTSRTKYPNWYTSRFVLWLPLPNPFHRLARWVLY